MHRKHLIVTSAELTRLRKESKESKKPYNIGLAGFANEFDDNGFLIKRGGRESYMIDLGRGTVNGKRPWKDSEEDTANAYFKQQLSVTDAEVKMLEEHFQQSAFPFGDVIAKAIPSGYIGQQSSRPDFYRRERNICRRSVISGFKLTNPAEMAESVPVPGTIYYEMIFTDKGMQLVPGSVRFSNSMLARYCRAPDGSLPMPSPEMFDEEVQYEEAVDQFQRLMADLKSDNPMLVGKLQSMLAEADNLVEQNVVSLSTLTRTLNDTRVLVRTPRSDLIASHTQFANELREFGVLRTLASMVVMIVSIITLIGVALGGLEKSAAIFYGAESLGKKAQAVIDSVDRPELKRGP